MGFGADRAARDLVAIAVCLEHGPVRLAGLFDVPSGLLRLLLLHEAHEDAKCLHIGRQRQRVGACLPCSMRSLTLAHQQASHGASSQPAAAREKHNSAFLNSVPLSSLAGRSFLIEREICFSSLVPGLKENRSWVFPFPFSPQEIWLFPQQIRFFPLGFGFWGDVLFRENPKFSPQNPNEAKGGNAKAESQGEKPNLLGKKPNLLGGKRERESPTSVGEENPNQSGNDANLCITLRTCAVLRCQGTVVAAAAAAVTVAVAVGPTATAAVVPAAPTVTTVVVHTAAPAVTTAMAMIARAATATVTTDVTTDVTTGDAKSEDSRRKDSRKVMVGKAAVPRTSRTISCSPGSVKKRIPACACSPLSVSRG